MENHWLYGKVCVLGQDHKRMSDLRVMPKGTVIKIVMVSRFGDVGITTDLEKEYGYETRITPDKISFEGLTQEQLEEINEMSEGHRKFWSEYEQTRS